MTDDAQMSIAGGGVSSDDRTYAYAIGRQFGKTFLAMDVASMYPSLLRVSRTLYASRRASDQKRWWKRIIG